MRLAELSTKLRDNSARYGGIGEYLKAADALDRACSEFFKEQSLESLQVLNGAAASAHRLSGQVIARPLVG